MLRRLQEQARRPPATPAAPIQATAVAALPQVAAVDMAIGQMVTPQTVMG